MNRRTWSGSSRQNRAPVARSPSRCGGPRCRCRRAEQRVESVLIRRVVAEKIGSSGSRRRSDRRSLQCFALVPVPFGRSSATIRPAVALSRGGCRRCAPCRHRRRGVGCSVAVVDSDGTSVCALRPPRGSGELFGQFGGCLLKQRNRLGRSLIVMVRTIRSHHLQIPWLRRATVPECRRAPDIGKIAAESTATGYSAARIATPCRRRGQRRGRVVRRSAKCAVNRRKMAGRRAETTPASWPNDASASGRLDIRRAMVRTGTSARSPTTTSAHIHVVARPPLHCGRRRSPDPNPPARAAVTPASESSPPPRGRTPSRRAASVNIADPACRAAPVLGDHTVDVEPRRGIEAG